MNQKVSLFAAALLLAQPLVAQWQDGLQLPMGYTPSCWGDCGNNFFIEVDYLLWFAEQDGTSFSTAIELASPTSGVQLQTTSQIDQDNFFKTRFHSGVKAILGYQPPMKSWDMRALYTYFSSTEHRNFGPFFLDGVPGSSVAGTFVIADYIETLGQAIANVTSTFASEWKLTFNQVDLEVGQDFYLSKEVTLRPFFGMRGLFVTQDFTILKVNSMAGGIFSTGASTIHFDPRIGFDGFGARVGFVGSVDLFYGFNLYGSASGSILWGKAHVSSLINSSVGSNGDTLVDTLNAVHQSHFTSSLNLDLEAGIQWQHFLDFGRQMVTFKLGWENRIYTNMNYLQNTTQVLNILNTFAVEDQNVYRGDLSLCGFIIGASFLY